MPILLTLHVCGSGELLFYVYLFSGDMNGVMIHRLKNWLILDKKMRLHLAVKISSFDCSCVHVLKWHLMLYTLLWQDFLLTLLALSLFLFHFVSYVTVETQTAAARLYNYEMVLYHSSSTNMHGL